MAGHFSTTCTNKHLKELLPRVLCRISAKHQERPDLILAIWPSLIGKRFASMTKAESFVDGVLTVRVNNSSLLSLLSQHERGKLLKELRKKFPKHTVRNIRFLIG